MKKHRILYIVNDSHPLKYFLKNHIDYLNSLGDFEISVIMNNSKNESFDNWKIKIFSVNINRKPNVVDDIRALFVITIHLLKNRYDIVHSLTPKAGLLAAFASFITLNKFRVHTFTGQVWANYSGINRIFYKLIDRVILILNTHILTDSLSQKEYLIENGVGNNLKIKVLNLGSICGVDFNKFKRDCNRASSLKAQVGIDSGSFVVLFVGRLNFEKGVLDLYKAFLKFEKDDLHLVFLGRDESNIIEYISKNFPNSPHQNFHFVNEVSNPEDYMSFSDILCLPSYREGFGNVVIESAALGVPSVVSNIYGLRDTIINNKTGLFFEVSNVDDLHSKLNFIYTNPNVLAEMKEACQLFIAENFDSEIITKCLYNYYKEILEHEK